tara:strand:- start:176 stop:895 length:720 start_codon:yes stop_codon:yes gene_type:complete
MNQTYFLFFLFIVSDCLAQSTLERYPEYYFKFTVSDSINYSGIYSDQQVRDSLKNEENNSHRAAKKIEEYILESQTIDFLERKNKSWDITLTNGSIKRLSIPNYSDVADYTLEHFYEKHQLIVFRTQYSEGNEYLVVSRITGREFTMWGPPSFSPNGKFFTSYNNDLMAGYSPNGIQLFEIIGNNPTLTINYPMDVGPSQTSWISDSTFHLETYDLGTTNGSLTYIYTHYIVTYERTGH